MDRKESRQLNYTKTRALPNTKIILHLHQVLKIIGCEGLCQIRGQVNTGMQDKMAKIRP